MTKSDAEYDEEYRARLLDPEAWRKTARQLLDVADLVEPKLQEFWSSASSGGVPSTSWRPWDDEYVAIYFMLCAYALQNAFKARIVEKRRSEIESQVLAKAKLPSLLASHDLYQLCIAAGKESQAIEEEDLLRRLERSSRWYGRYPVPEKSWGLRTTREAKSRDFPIRLTHYTTSDADWIRRLLSEFGLRREK